MRVTIIKIISFLSLVFLIECNAPDSRSNNIEQIALNIINNLDSNSNRLLREYEYIRRGDNDFWLKLLSSDRFLYACTYKLKKDSIELSISGSQNFTLDFPSNLNFDTSLYHQFIFSQVHDTIVRITRVDKHGQDKISDTSILTKHLFPNHDPFAKFAELTSLKDKFHFIGTSYSSDNGNMMIFWLTPQYKLTYLPDTLQMKPKSKKFWLDEFNKGNQLKQHWSLIKVYD